MSQEIKIKLMGTSMSPQLFENDTLLFAPCQKAELKIGDIAVFKENDEIVIHRLVKYKGHLYFKGDASLVLSPFDTITEVLGVVNRFHRGDKTYHLCSYPLLISYFSVVNSSFYPAVFRKIVRLLSRGIISIF